MSETVRMTVEEALARMLTYGPARGQQRPSDIVTELASLGFAIIPTAPDLPEMRRAVKAGGKALWNSVPLIYGMTEDGAFSYARACLDAALKEFAK